MIDYLFLLPAILAGLWTLWLRRRDNREGTPKERARRYMRDLEHGVLVRMEPPETRVADGGSATNLLLRMLIEDLKQVEARRHVVMYFREQYDLDLEASMEVPPLFPWWPKRWRRTL